VQDPIAPSVEAICMVSDQPVPSAMLAEVLEVSVAKIDEVCQQLAREYEDADRGFMFVNVAGGWRYQSHPDQAPFVERFVLDGQSAKLSGAALETLAIIAYKQPLSRAQIAAIRGVNVDGVLKTLQQRGYVTELGHDPGPGQATLFGTTPLFLEKIGIAQLEDLPPLGDFVPDAQLVELLEQGLRPINAIDLGDGDEDELLPPVVIDDEVDDDEESAAVDTQTLPANEHSV
jgi:segregation and condensation protein B